MSKEQVLIRFQARADRVTKEKLRLILPIIRRIVLSSAVSAKSFFSHPIIVQDVVSVLGSVAFKC